MKYEYRAVPGISSVELEREERAKRVREREEKEQFLRGLKKYSELGIPVYIDNKEPGPDDWEKLTTIREDHRFYMGDFIQDLETGELKEIRFDMVYHGDLSAGERKRGRRKKEPGEEK